MENKNIFIKIFRILRIFFQIRPDQPPSFWTLYPC